LTLRRISRTNHLLSPVGVRTSSPSSIIVATAPSKFDPRTWFAEMPMGKRLDAAISGTHVARRLRFLAFASLDEKTAGFFARGSNWVHSRGPAPTPWQNGLFCDDIPRMSRLPAQTSPCSSVQLGNVLAWSWPTVFACAACPRPSQRPSPPQRHPFFTEDRLNWFPIKPKCPVPRAPLFRR